MFLFVLNDFYVVIVTVRHLLRIVTLRLLLLLVVPLLLIWIASELLPLLHSCRSLSVSAHVGYLGIGGYSLHSRHAGLSLAHRILA